jgi:hypothetical protein
MNYLMHPTSAEEFMGGLSTSLGVQPKPWTPKG